MREGERQVAPTLEGIRRDHVARYEWAAREIPPGSRVVDFACGVGYGSQILADAGHQVTGFDVDPEAVEYARKHYPRAEYRLADGCCPLRAYDCAVCFETIEHIEDPRRLLESLRGARHLLASVPNEDVMPFGVGYAFHHRHYTRGQFEHLLRSTGWRVRQWLGQVDDESAVLAGVDGRTLVVLCDRVEIPCGDEEDIGCTPAADDGDPPPEHVAIVGLGPTSSEFEGIVKRLGGRHAFCDEVWTINALGDVLACDRVFHMDDVRIQEIRARERPDSNIARMLQWMRTHRGPIYTSRTHPDYPGLVAFPFEAVANSTGKIYANSTAAWAIAFAVHVGVKRLSLFGMDFTYPDAHEAEQGRACVEFWLGYASARGVKVAVAKRSTLLDACEPVAHRMYGYDTVDVKIDEDGGRFSVSMTERAALPTAEAIEARYDHGQHPNRLVREGA